MSALESHRSWAEIDLSAIRHNAAVARERVGGRVELLAIIKANAYGHGVIEVAQALAEQAQIFGVANLQEALAVRAVAPHPIMLMGTALPAERSAIVEAGFIASVSSYEEAREFSQCGALPLALLTCAVDSGMGRMGMPEDDAVAEILRISTLPKVVIHSLSTHLPSPEDENYTHAQLGSFSEIVNSVRAEIGVSLRAHVLASAGVISFAEAAHQIVRAGLMLYGISPVAEFQVALRPALTWKTRILLLRELAAGATVSYGRTFVAPRPMRVATLSVGYADGLPRALSNRGATVLISGQRCALLGRVTMDLVMVDVTDVPNVQVGDEVVLIGRQGSEQILATELAEKASTIAWEIFTGIGSRVTRVYV